MSLNPYDPPHVDGLAVDAELICSNCGSTLKKGVVHALGSITWYPEAGSFSVSVPERLSPKGINLESRIEGFKCTACETITLKTS